MNVCTYHALALSALLLSAGSGYGETIDLSKPLPESLTPDILYFNFDEESTSTLLSQTELHFTASVEPGKVDAMPTWKSGRNAAFGHAIEFNYGSIPTSMELNEQKAGNHLRISDHSELQLVDRSFTLGAWIKLSKSEEMPSRAYKKLFSKGAYAEGYPGWALQISSRENVWVMTFLMANTGSPLARFDSALSGGPEPDTWHHVAVSFDAEKRELRLWFDGKVVQTKNVSENIGESTAPLILGENGMSLYCNIPLTMDEVFIVSGVHDFIPSEP